MNESVKGRGVKGLGVRGRYSEFEFRFKFEKNRVIKMSYQNELSKKGFSKYESITFLGNNHYREILC